MGWFLTKKKTHRPRRRRAAAASKPWGPKRTLAGLKVLGALTALVLLAVVWHYGELSLKRYVAERHQQAAAPADVSLIDAPAWMSPMLREDLQRLVAGQFETDPLDPTDLQCAVLALAGSPWVEQVNAVRRSTAGRVHVQARYRQPVAIVEARDGYHLVDERGVRLPGLYLKHQLDELALPLIVGAASAPREEGAVWPGDDVRAGLDLVGLLAGESYVNDVAAIDVGARDARGRIRLILRTERGGKVVWGLPPGQDVPVEPDAATKLRRLRAVCHQKGGHIDAGGKIVEIYGAAVLIHQSVSRLPGGAARGARIDYTSSR